MIRSRFDRLSRRIGDDRFESFANPTRDSLSVIESCECDSVGEFDVSDRRCALTGKASVGREIVGVAREIDKRGRIDRSVCDEH